MSYEESYGYMLGDYVRDKDAVTASLILTEMAAWYAVQGMTLFDALNALYEKYGYYGEKDPQSGDARPGRPGEDGSADAGSAGRSPGRYCRGGGPAPQGLYRRQRHRLPHRRKNPPWSCPAATCCAMSWRTAPPSWCGFSGTEPKIKVYVLTIGETPAARNENLRKYGEWVKTLQR